MPSDPIVEWVTDPNTAFLLGAGCSLCAGKPSMADLTDKLKPQLDPASEALFEQMDNHNGRSPNIEDFLTQLLQLRRLLSGRKGKTDGTWELIRVNDVITKTANDIVQQIGTDWEPSDVHARFMKRLAMHRGRCFCDVFSLNYDLVAEATLEDIAVPYIDGFRGAENAFFDPAVYGVGIDGSTVFRIYKLHGSISWCRDQQEIVRRRPAKSICDGDRLVIYPSEQKYYDTRYGIYETLMGFFRQRLRTTNPNNKLVVLGYSLSDDHITEAIVDAILTPGSNLSVYAFLGEDADVKAQVTRLQAIVDRCVGRLNVMVGRHCFLGAAMEPSEWSAIRDLDLWKFENMVDHLTGGRT